MTSAVSSVAQVTHTDAFEQRAGLARQILTQAGAYQAARTIKGHANDASALQQEVDRQVQQWAWSGASGELTLSVPAGLAKVPGLTGPGDFLKQAVTAGVLAISGDKAAPYRLCKETLTRSAWESVREFWRGTWLEYLVAAELRLLQATALPQLADVVAQVEYLRWGWGSPLLTRPERVDGEVDVFAILGSHVVVFECKDVDLGRVKVRAMLMDAIDKLDERRRELGGRYGVGVLVLNTRESPTRAFADGMQDARARCQVKRIEVVELVAGKPKAEKLLQDQLVTILEGVGRPGARTR